MGSLAGTPEADAGHVYVAPVESTQLFGPTGDEVIGEGYAILNLVAVVSIFAKTDPDTRIPAPLTPGSAVCALRFVCTSEADGKLLRVRLTCAKELGAIANTTLRATNPNTNFDLNVI